MMRKGSLLLMLSLGGLGCLSSGSHVKKEAQQAPPVQMTIAPAPHSPPAVTVDQVTEGNTADVVQALTREMDFDATVRPPAAPPLPMPSLEHTVSP